MHFDFCIPQGETGASGEVTPGELEAAIATSARNPTGIGPWSGSFSGPEMQAFADYVESLRQALAR